jgi:hypothetical protein
MRSNSAKALRADDFRVVPEDRPGWVLGSERMPAIGEKVYCARGEGVMVALHGRTGDGSRLIQIRLPDEKAAPFFAATSNVLVSPD